MTVGTLLLVMSVIVVTLMAIVRHLSLTRGPIYAAEFRRYGREWAAEGQQARSDWCHAHADWCEKPWWEFRWPPPLKPPDLVQKRKP